MQELKKTSKVGLHEFAIGFKTKTARLFTAQVGNSRWSTYSIRDDSWHLKYLNRSTDIEDQVSTVKELVEKLERRHAERIVKVFAFNTTRELIEWALIKD